MWFFFNMQNFKGTYVICWEETFPPGRWVIAGLLPIMVLHVRTLNEPRESLKGIQGDGRRFSFSVAAAWQQLITGLYVSGRFRGAGAPGMHGTELSVVDWPVSSSASSEIITELRTAAPLLNVLSWAKLSQAKLS